MRHEVGHDRSKILQTLEIIEKSQHFAKADSQKRILKYLVLKTLEGAEDGHFKEGAIGSSVLNRPVGYDVVLDPIARVTIARLRKNLVAFYHSEEGNTTPATIVIEPGSYKPRFEGHILDADDLPTAYENARKIGLQLRTHRALITELEEAQDEILKMIADCLGFDLGASERAYLLGEPVHRLYEDEKIYDLPATWGGMLYLYQQFGGTPPPTLPFSTTDSILSVLQRFHYRTQYEYMLTSTCSLDYPYYTIELGCVEKQQGRSRFCRSGRCEYFDAMSAENQAWCVVFGTWLRGVKFESVPEAV